LLLGAAVAQTTQTTTQTMTQTAQPPVSAAPFVATDAPKTSVREAPIAIEQARIDSLNLEQHKITVVDLSQADDTPLDLKTSDANEGRLARMQAGDRVRLSYTSGGELKNIRLLSRTVELWRRASAIAAAALIYLALLWVCTNIGKIPPTQKHGVLSPIVGCDGHYSNSKFQLASWFALLITGYLCLVGLRLWTLGWEYFGGLSIPQNLLLLSGMSVLSFGGAKAITQSKVDKESKEEAASDGQGTAQQQKDAGLVETQPGWNNLVRNDFGTFDFGDFQMLVVTLLALSSYALLLWHATAKLEYATTMILPDVDTTVLSAFGLGQGAYLIKKFTGKLKHS